MSHGFYLNFEILAMEVIENEITKMSDDNKDDRWNDIDVLDEDKFISNLYHGSIVATFVVNLYESALNTILGRRLGCSEIEIFKSSHDVKLQLICTMFHVDIGQIKSASAYSYLRSIIRIRNDILHFKSNKFGEGVFVLPGAKFDMGATKEPIAKVFTQSHMRKCYSGVLDLLQLICEKCGLVMNKDCQIIDCDARDQTFEFILTQKAYDERDMD